MLRRCGWLLALGSCFGTLPSATGGAGDDAPCTAGARLCPCDAGACDPGLVCAPSVDRCVSEECDVGELECPCADAMQCEGELVCIDSLCAGPQDTGGDASVGTTGPGPTATASPGTSDPSATFTETGMTTAADTTGSLSTSTGEVSSSAADTGSLCASGTCNDCYVCAMADDGPCGVEADACEMEAMMAPPPCFSIIYGFQMCEPNPSCTVCPAPADPDGTALVNCLIAECSSLDCKCV